MGPQIPTCVCNKTLVWVQQRACCCPMLGQGLLQAGQPAKSCSHCQTCSRATSTWLRKDTSWLEFWVSKRLMVWERWWWWWQWGEGDTRKEWWSLLSPLPLPLTLAITLTARYCKSHHTGLTLPSLYKEYSCEWACKRCGCQSKAAGGRRGSATLSADQNMLLPMLQKTASVRYLWEGQEDNQHSDVLNMQIYIWRLLEIKYFKAITLIRDFLCIWCNETQMKRITSAHCT